MTKLIPLFIILMSFSTYGQNKTGTGGEFDDPFDPFGLKERPYQPLNLSGGGNSQEIKLYNFTSSLRTQEKYCRSKKHRYLSFDNADFMDTYLKFSVLKNTFEADDKCKTISEYFKCLYSVEVKKQMKAITEDKEITKHLKKKYKLSTKEVKGIINFFETLDTSCEANGACKM